MVENPVRCAGFVGHHQAPPLGSSEINNQRLPEVFNYWFVAHLVTDVTVGTNSGNLLM